MCVFWRSSMCCCFLPQMFSFVFNGQKSQACLTPPTDGSVQYLKNPRLATDHWNTDAYFTNTWKGIPTQTSRIWHWTLKKTQEKNTNYCFLWNVRVFKVKEHPSSLIQNIDVNEHMKMFLINTCFCYVIVTELIVLPFPLLPNFMF